MRLFSQGKPLFLTSMQMTSGNLQRMRSDVNFNKLFCETENVLRFVQIQVKSSLRLFRPPLTQTQRGLQDHKKKFTKQNRLRLEVRVRTPKSLLLLAQNAEGYKFVI